MGKVPEAFALQGSVPKEGSRCTCRQDRQQCLDWASIQIQKTAKNYNFCMFFVIFWARVRSQRLLQALPSNFPSKMRDLDA